MNFENNVTERNLIYKYIRFNIKITKFRHNYKYIINLKLDFSRHIYAADQSVVNAPPLGGAASPCRLTYLSKLARGDIGAQHISSKAPLCAS